MKRLILLFAVVVLSVDAPLLHAKDPAAAPSKKATNAMRLTDADNKKTVALPVGTSFDVALKGNASTGYQWQLGKIGGDIEGLLRVAVRPAYSAGGEDLYPRKPRGYHGPRYRGSAGDLF